MGVLSDRDLSMASQGSRNVTNEQLVKDLMSDEPFVVEPSAEIEAAIQEMLDRKINSLIVRAEANEPWGIITSTDLLRYVVKKG